MSTVLAIIALVIVLAIVIILVLAMRKPATFRLERSTTIKAPPEKIFPFVNDFHRWMTWSPWEKTVSSFANCTTRFPSEIFSSRTDT